jgi:hypothetical protein
MWEIIQWYSIASIFLGSSSQLVLSSGERNSKVNVIPKVGSGILKALSIDTSTATIGSYCRNSFLLGQMLSLLT